MIKREREKNRRTAEYMNSRTAERKREKGDVSRQGAKNGRDGSPSRPPHGGRMMGE